MRVNHIDGVVNFSNRLKLTGILQKRFEIWTLTNKSKIVLAGVRYLKFHNCIIIMCVTNGKFSTIIKCNYHKI
jgi:hypothetical protein